MEIHIVSGLSGSGKTVALHALEDDGFYCIDNLPIGLLAQVVTHLQNTPQHTNPSIALGVDARNAGEELKHFPEVIADIKSRGHNTTVLFLHAEQQALLKRFSETRRKHPLSHEGLTLIEALDWEKELLSPVLLCADLSIDTTSLNIHELNLLLRQRLGNAASGTHSLSLLIQSFGFKHGMPLDSDFIFDIRCLPNPYWEPHLRQYTGLDSSIVDYLNNFEEVNRMQTSIETFLDTWAPSFSQSNRSYLTVSIGCTGGKHRSVFMAEAIGAHLRKSLGEYVSIRHRDLKNK